MDKIWALPLRGTQTDGNKTMCKYIHSPTHSEALSSSCTVECAEVGTETVVSDTQQGTLEYEAHEHPRHRHRERQRGVSISSLVVLSVGVRGLADSVRGVDLVMELSAGGCSFTTGPLRPILVRVKAANAHDDRLHMTIARCPLNSEVLGLNALCIVIPVLDGSAGFKDADNGNMPPPYLTHGGLHVGLRTADTATLLGVATCSESGGWFPLSPCKGEVQVMFRRCYRRNNDVFPGASSPRQTFLDRISPFNGLCSRGASGTAAAAAPPPPPIRPTNNGGVAATVSSAKCTAHPSPEKHTGCRWNTSSNATAAEVAYSTWTSLKECISTNKQCVLPECSRQRPCSSKPLGVAGNLASVGATTSLKGRAYEHSKSSSRLGTRHALVEGWGSNTTVSHTLWCQPRSLLLSNVRVSGFFPLLPHGKWSLEFSWRHRQVAPIESTVVIPLNVGADGAVRLEDSICIDLPLFLRGELKAHVYAIWSGTCDTDSGAQEHLHLRVEFDPIVVDVQDCEGQWEFERRQGPVFPSLNPRTQVYLVVQLVAKLEFFEPQRDGHNGRPTSAFPRRYLLQASDPMSSDTEDGDDSGGGGGGGYDDNAQEDEEDKKKTLESIKLPDPALVVSPVPHYTQTSTCSFPALLSSLSSCSFETQRAVRSPAYELCTGQSPVEATKGALSYPSEGEVACGSRFLQHTTSAKANPHLPLCHKRAGKQQQQQQQQHLRASSSRGVFCSHATSARPFPEVQHLVPCYSKAKREAVFRLYDREGRGYITLNQLFHFCRAHVALYSCEESDASILRGLWHHLPGMAPYYVAAFAPSMPSACKHTSSSPGDGTFSSAMSAPGDGTPNSSPVLSNAAEPDTACTAMAILSAKLSEGGRKGITYDIFEVIALHLVGM